LLRGWFGVFSMGLDAVTDQLKAQGINAEVAGHLSWQNEVAEILRERAAGRTGPLILVGHSQGANNVIDMARALEPSHVTVDLLITLSPFMQNRVPPNVACQDQNEPNLPAGRSPSVRKPYFLSRKSGAHTLNTRSATLFRFGSPLKRSWAV
jgi:alpha-beta hydrolase superfamily lysophospholipase